MRINLDLIEKEHLVGRLKLIELLERQSFYRELRDRVERRFSQALTMIPPDFREAALVIFGSTLYITKEMLEDAWKYVWSVFCKRIRGAPRFQDLLIFELDRDLLRDDFYRANALVGRLQDNLPFRSTHDMIDALMQVESGQMSPELKAVLPMVVERPYWILLIDLSISGTSAASELERLRRICTLLSHGKKVTIVALIQLATEQATTELRKTGCEFISAINVPLSCALNTKTYRMISDRSIVNKMRELCIWFAETHVVSTSYRLAKISKAEDNPDIASFGFGGMGWNIVTYKNTPNNSLPILWFRPPNDEYRPPFERIDSRIGSPWGGRKEWLERIEKDDNLRRRILQEIDHLRRR